MVFKLQLPQHLVHLTLHLVGFHAVDTSKETTYHPTRSAGGLVQTCQHVHSRRLACTVGTQESEYLAPLYTERDVVNCMEIAKGFYQMFHLDDVIFFYFCYLLVFNAWRIEDTGKLGEDIVGSTNAAHLTLIQKSDAFTAAHLIEIRR